MQKILQAKQLYSKAILFYFIAGYQFLASIKHVSGMFNGVQAFMLGIELCFMNTAQECLFYNIVRLRNLPKIRVLLRSVFDCVIGKDKVVVELLRMNYNAYRVYMG